MLIRELTEDECRRAIPQVTLGRLACAEDGQPYVVPVYLAFSWNYLYGFSSLGRKIACMRANPLVCVEIDEIRSVDEWTTLIVFGVYEELADTPKNESARLLAHELLGKRAVWWQPAWVAVTNTKQAKQFTPVFYRILIDRVTGYRASREQSPDRSRPPGQHRGLKGFLRQMRSRK